MGTGRWPRRPGRRRRRTRPAASSRFPESARRARWPGTPGRSSRTGPTPGIRWKLPGGTPDPESCDARDAALIRDGTEERVEAYCDVASGNWFDPYGGRSYTDPGDIDIDHVVPLANAWRSGASSWSTTKRESFANVPRTCSP